MNFCRFSSKPQNLQKNNPSVTSKVLVKIITLISNLIHYMNQMSVTVCPEFRYKATVNIRPMTFNFIYHTTLQVHETFIIDIPLIVKNFTTHKFRWIRYLAGKLIRT